MKKESSNSNQDKNKSCNLFKERKNKYNKRQNNFLLNSFNLSKSTKPDKKKFRVITKRDKQISKIRKKIFGKKSLNLKPKRENIRML